ncbi:transporter substrate-binding domain-containing protein [uncultured Roseibium sp.]|uniref:transporter substrate-binding domain-containing protein n=1 Tax=uncultured Roseibium sp. TaxID=1936171 RepID=UPI003217C7A6
MSAGQQRFFRLLSTLLLILASSLASHAQDGDSGKLKVGIHDSPPFVMHKDGQPAGMAVDLWKELADELGVTYQYQVFPTVRGLVDATADGQIDVAVTNLTVTRKRAERIDFTQPWFDAGLRIMVNEDRGSGFAAIVEGLRDAGHLQAYGWLAFVIVAATVFLTLFDRRFNPDFPGTWRDGMAESFYSVMSVATSGRLPSRKNTFGWIGRVMQAFWLVCGIAVLAYVTSSVTSVMTTLSLSSQIHSLEDLPGTTSGVFEGSIAEEFAREEGLRTRSYDNIDAAVSALLSNDIAAIIGDAPVLEYYAYKHPGEPLDVVGPLFEPDKYAFALPPNSPLTRPLSLAILSAKEKGFVEDLRIKYFGEAQ